MKTLVGIVAAAAVLAGCGSQDATPAAKDPGSAPPGAPVAPHWPAKGCDVRSGSSIDYVADARGAATPRQALATYRPAGTTVVRAKSKPHREAAWLVVDDDNEIVRSVTMFRGSNGWLVDGVEECSH
jgi:hypothetical protein